MQSNSCIAYISKDIYKPIYTHLVHEIWSRL